VKYIDGYSFAAIQFIFLVNAHEFFAIEGD
jgi:hypothetical protein